MSEEKFKVGDRVVLTLAGKRLACAPCKDKTYIIVGVRKYYKCCCLSNGAIVYAKKTDIKLYEKVSSLITKNGVVQNKVVEFEKLTTQMLETFKKKNADYGDSTTQTFKEFGLTSYAIRLNDKLNRIKSFCKKGGLEVKDESCIDTLMDMASYCLLAVIDIKNKENGKDNKE